jgi:hypothetical protein
MAIYIFMQGTMIVKEIHPVLQNAIISGHDKYHSLLVITYHCTFDLYTLRKFLIDHF